MRPRAPTYTHVHSQRQRRGQRVDESAYFEACIDIVRLASRRLELGKERMQPPPVVLWHWAKQRRQEDIRLVHVRSKHGRALH